MAYDCVQCVLIGCMCLFIVKRKQPLYVYMILGHGYLNIYMNEGNKESERVRRAPKLHKTVQYPAVGPDSLATSYC